MLTLNVWIDPIFHFQKYVSCLKTHFSLIFSPTSNLSFHFTAPFSSPRWHEWKHIQSSIPASTPCTVRQVHSSDALQVIRLRHVWRTDLRWVLSASSHCRNNKSYIGRVWSSSARRERTLRLLNEAFKLLCSAGGSQFRETITPLPCRSYNTPPKHASEVTREVALHHSVYFGLIILIRRQSVFTERPSDKRAGFKFRV